MGERGSRKRNWGESSRCSTHSADTKWNMIIYPSMCEASQGFRNSRLTPAGTRGADLKSPKRWAHCNANSERSHPRKPQERGDVRWPKFECTTLRPTCHSCVQIHT